MSEQPEDLTTQLWYYEGAPYRHCELVARLGEVVTLKPIDGSPTFNCNGSFVWPVRPPR